jgi:glycosyltransferase involved in cell wall biosynthesis
MTKRHRIGLFIPDMNSMGGIQQVAVNMARDLRDRYDVVIVSMFSVHGRLFDDAGAPIVSLGFPYAQGQFNPRIRQILPVAARLRRVVADHQLDTIIGFWLHVSSIAAVALPRHVRTIGFEHIAFFGSKGYWAKVRKWCYPRLSAIVSLSEADREHLMRLNTNVRVIPNFVKIPSGGPAPSREKILLAVGHIEHRKGLDRLLLALKQPLLAFPDWKFVFVGGGELGHTEHWTLSYLRDLAELLHIGRQVEFQPGTKAIGEWYDRASIYVMGSRLEGFPLVLLEAKAHGLPAIA